MDDKRPIPLNYADESVRLEDRGPIPDGYLGYRAPPTEPEEEDDTEPQVTIDEGIIALLTTPVFIILVLGVLLYFLLG